MAFTRETLSIVQCDVCGDQAPAVSGARTPKAAENLARAHHDWIGFAIRNSGREDRWHACPACRHSEEFNLGKPAAELLIEKGTTPSRAWTVVNALVNEGMIS